MKTTAETILFAINAAIRLGRNTRQAYAKSLKSRAIVLPLPRFITLAQDLQLARTFFSDTDAFKGGARFLNEIEHLRSLHERDTDPRNPRPLTELERGMYYDYFKRFYLTLQAGNEGSLSVDQVSAEELASMLRIRQWERGLASGTSPLQTVAGTLVELGIDYFHQVPGALNTDSSLGKVMFHFLTALDQIPFSQQPLMQARMQRILPLLFVAAAESTAELSEEIRADEHIQTFIQIAAAGIASDLSERLQGLNARQEVSALRWGPIILRSVVSNAAGYVFAQPGSVFTDLNDGAKELIRQTGSVLLEVLIQDPDSLNVAAGLNRDNLDRLLQTAFGVVAAHPQLIHAGPGFRQIVEGVSAALARSSFQQPAYLPEIARLILFHSAHNLPELWRSEGQGFRNILLTAVQETLFVLSSDTTGAWRPQLQGEQLLGLLNKVLEITAQNPAWITEAVGGRTLLRTLLLTAIDGLATAPAEERLGPAVFLSVLDELIVAFSEDAGLLASLQLFEDQDEKMLLRRSLRLIVSATLNNAVTHPAARRVELHRLLQFTLRSALAVQPNEQGLRVLELVIRYGFPPDGAGHYGRLDTEELLNLGLSVLATYPELITQDEALSSLVSQLASRLSPSLFGQPQWMGKLIRLCLKITAENAGLVVQADQSPPRYLVAAALAEFLLLLHGEDAHGPWRPNMSPDRLLASGELLLERLLNDHHWLLALQGEQTIWRAVLQATMDSFSRIQVGERLRPQVLEMVVWNGIRAALQAPELLTAVRWTSDTHEKVLLSHLLDMVVSFVYPDSSSPAERTVLLDNLLRFTVEDLLHRYPNRKGLLLLDFVLATYNYRHDQPFDAAEANRLIAAILPAIELHPEWIVEPELFQRIIRDLAASLQAVNLPLGQLLPEVLRLALRIGGSYGHLLLEPPPGSIQAVLVMALQQSLDVLTQGQPDGSWRPRMKEEELLAILEVVFLEVQQQPAWVARNFVRIVLSAIVDGIQAAQLERPLPASTLLLLIREGMAAIRFRPQWVIHLTGQEGEEDRQLLLSFALSQVLITLHEPSSSETVQWTIQQQAVLEAILLTYLLRISEGPASEGLVGQLIGTLEASMESLAYDVGWTQEQLLNQLSRV